MPENGNFPSRLTIFGIPPCNWIFMKTEKNELELFLSSFKSFSVAKSEHSWFY